MPRLQHPQLSIKLGFLSSVVLYQTAGLLCSRARNGLKQEVSELREVFARRANLPVGRIKNLRHGPRRRDSPRKRTDTSPLAETGRYVRTSEPAGTAGVLGP